MDDKDETGKDGAAKGKEPETGKDGAAKGKEPETGTPGAAKGQRGQTGTPGAAKGQRGQTGKSPKGGKDFAGPGVEGEKGQGPTVVTGEHVLEALRAKGSQV